MRKSRVATPGAGDRVGGVDCETGVIGGDACGDVGGRAAGPGCADADLGMALTMILRAYGRAAEEALADLPGGGRAFRLLTSVAQDQPPSQLAVAQRVGLDRTVVTYLLDDLVGRGLVERRTDPADRRAWRVVITADGRQRLEEYRTRLASVERALLAPLDGAEAAQLRTLLDRVAERLRADPACPLPPLGGPSAVC